MKPSHRHNTRQRLTQHVFLCLWSSLWSFFCTCVYYTIVHSLATIVSFAYRDTVANYRSFGCRAFGALHTRRVTRHASGKTSSHNEHFFWYYAIDRQIIHSDYQRCFALATDTESAMHNTSGSTKCSIPAARLLSLSLSQTFATITQMFEQFVNEIIFQRGKWDKTISEIKS